MTRLDWSKARRPRWWDYERSPYRPVHAFDALVGGLERRRDRPAPKPEAPLTLASLAGDGVNRIAKWCASCRVAEHCSIEGLPADVLALPVAHLGDVVRCGRCSASTVVTPFREGPAKHVGPHLP